MADKILNLLKTLYDTKEKIGDLNNKINNKIDEKYADDQEKATKVKKYFKGAIVVGIALIIYVVVNMLSGPDYANDREIFVGKDSYGSSYYLLTDSIDQDLTGYAMGGAFLGCRIKIVQSNNEIRYFGCKFYSANKYEDSNGNVGVFNKNDNSIVANTYLAIIKHMEESIKQGLEKEKKSGRYN